MIKFSFRLRGSDAHSNVSYGFVDFTDNLGMRKAFASKVFIKGKHVKIALSRFAMEIVLNKSTAFFYEVRSLFEILEHFHCITQFSGSFAL